jgi:hypothetical protein
LGGYENGSSEEAAESRAVRDFIAGNEINSPQPNNGGGLDEPFKKDELDDPCVGVVLVALTYGVELAVTRDCDDDPDK